MHTPHQDIIKNHEIHHKTFFIKEVIEEMHSTKANVSQNTAQGMEQSKVGFLL
jgi:hypothetical protein